MHLLAAVLVALHLAAVPAALAQVPPGDSARKPPPVRRRPVTAEHERTAFADASARTLLERARAARVAQDSALHAYDARTQLRFTIGLALRRLGPERLLLRTEHAARVRWARGAGIWVEPTGRRTAFPMGRAQLDLTEATPIPYFPGRESLWIPSGEMRVVRAEVDENEMLHPLATGAEAYYRYESGDSASIRLPDGRTIALRELRVTARRPDWRAFVGSFWFDAERGSLVRAAYRMATEIDLWRMATEEEQRDLQAAIERAQADTSAIARAAVRAAEESLKEEKRGSRIANLLLGPVRANLSAVTVEYGLHEGRFWLPRVNVAEGEVRSGLLRVPMRFEERFRYDAVNGDDALPPVPSPGELGLAADDTTYAGGGVVNIGAGSGRAPDSSRVHEDSLLHEWTARADSLGALADSARAKGDTARARQLSSSAGYQRARARQLARRRDACASADSSYLAGVTTRYGGALRMAIRMPCDTSGFATSPDLPGSIYAPGEAVFGEAERDELVKSLGFGLQPAWAPQPPVVRTGLDLLRYNRVEGLSAGVAATSVLGLGYEARALARIGTGDWMPNGELSLSRTNGRRELRLGLFHRLGVANDDWGAPLSPGASLANLLYARDEGFYYRTWGAELAGTRDTPVGGATMLWRLFAERQRGAGQEPNVQASLGHLLGDARFRPNIDAVPLTALGAAGDLARSFGADPRALRVDARLRGEGAFTDRSDSVGRSGYGRVAGDVTLARDLGPFALALTGGAGGSVGDLPPQRAFYVGGLQTVRGQFARLDGPGRVGDAFWLGRAELGLGSIAARPSLFYDVGWAGRREDFGRPGRPLSGAGAGVSFLDGLLRFDVARGIHPERRWRVDLYLGARF